MRKTIVWAVVPMIAMGVVLSAGGPAVAAGIQASFTASLSGAAEVPGPGDPNGAGDFAAITTRNTLCYALAAKGIARATASHIHVGGPDVAGPVSVTLQPATRDGVSGCFTAVPDDEDTSLTLSRSELAEIKRHPGRYYVNVHNAEFPAGAVRGQLSAGHGG